MFPKLAGLTSRLRSPEFHAETFDSRSSLGDSAWLLYGLARSIKSKVCVEIGSARGRSACAVGLALRRNGSRMIYAINPHTHTDWNDSESTGTLRIPTKHLNKADVSDFVEIIRETSTKAATNWRYPIDLIFIDGDHSYKGVKADWDCFVPHVTEFGVVVFHDTIWDLRPDPKWSRADMGVPRFVDELRAAGYPIVTIDQNFGVSLVQPRIGGVKLR